MRLLNFAIYISFSPAFSWLAPLTYESISGINRADELWSYGSPKSKARNAEFSQTERIHWGPERECCS